MSSVFLRHICSELDWSYRALDLGDVARTGDLENFIVDNVSKEPCTKAVACAISSSIRFSWWFASHS